ncbi:hypothetical protein GLAREA_01690 [Glarea lozoyensis ATCC 20868]|uniref:Uncharacterized protein n=1 Tax=Glarea lozoyensis (strain ATCC 20868 / MF5171) TaxID=1116229 RepID=S3DGT4_GLAL2|nr:uncharacterized protein GLAREA_01690 [Glarea lozoyensis ATCC 20868]EPE25778.1 hypothetical protein GLAREA_01690 [Glarea lozoyensis ATCC 20868]
MESKRKLVTPHIEIGVLARFSRRTANRSRTALRDQQPQRLDAVDVGCLREQREQL